MGSIYTILAKNQTDEEVERFKEMFPVIVEDVTASIREDMPQLKDHVEQLFNYLVPNGGSTRGLVVSAVYRMFEKDEKLTPEKLQFSYILAWVIEMLHAIESLVDDIIDGSDQRRGLPCWHTKNGIGLNGVNDGVILEQAIYYLIRKYFKNNASTLLIYQQLHDMLMKGTCGQALRSRLTRKGKPVLKLFTIENYRSLVKYKVAYNSFYGPVALAMFSANITDAELHKKAKRILLQIGLLFQMENDFSDCFGDVEKTGVRGKNIRGGKCTWLVVKALEKADSGQRQIIEKHYGSTDPEAVENICNVYEELDLPKMYAEHKKESLGKIHHLARKLSEEHPREVFPTIVETALTIL